MITQELLPGFRWPVTVAQPIAAPAEKVWDVISTPGNLERCHPYCKRNPVQVWSGPDSRDEVHYYSGWIFERRFRLRPMLKKYLESVTKGFERYVTRGEPVSRDQFGRHPWFSAARP